MTLIKSILLGSAAGIVAVASAQAADLPTKKAAPVVQYVKICNVGGITGWTLPGSDTCVKLSGYITAQFTGGNLQTQYNYASFGTVATAIAGSNPALSATLAALARRSTRVPLNGSSSRPATRKRTRLSGVTRPAGRPAPTSASTSPRTPPTAR